MQLDDRAAAGDAGGAVHRGRAAKARLRVPRAGANARHGVTRARPDLHLPRHERGDERDRAYARVGLRRTSADRALARRRPRRRRLVHGERRLTTRRVVHDRRPVVPRSRSGDPPGWLRSPGAARASLPDRPHDPLPAGRRVPGARRAPEARSFPVTATPPARLDRGHPRAGGRRDLPGALGARDPRRLRPGGDGHRHR